LPIEAFLTAFDPSDLPGGSLDPLGFDRGYTFLADKILPGLTNVANRPRYFSVLCAGVALANIDETALPKRLHAERRLAVLRLERLWALANVLAAADREGAASGIRGITYVADEAARLRDRSAKTASPKFKLLSRQEPYGVLGIYGALAEGLRLLVDRKTFTLSPDAGDRLAQAFLDETAIPDDVREAVVDERDVPLAKLQAWGERAMIGAAPGKEESACLADALRLDPVRARMAALLKRVPATDEEAELKRVGRIAKTIADGGPDADLKDALQAILAFEESYRLSILAFERLLFLCRVATGAVVSRADERADEVLARVRDALPRAVGRLDRVLDQRRTNHLAGGIERIEDARRFLARAAAACDSSATLVDEVVARHVDVQHGKFDRGRRKMPWLERTSAGLTLTSTRAGGASGELTSPDEVTPHPYRLGAATALLHAAEGA
jgi:hypothetical protein